MNKADSTRLALIVEMGCVVCIQEGLGATLAEVHHLTDCGRRMGHQHTIGLCFGHHRSGVRTDEYVSRHPYKAEFERRYGKELALLDIVNRRLEGWKT